MSDAPTSSRLPLIATGFAIVAVLCALVAVVVVLTRDDGAVAAKPPAVQPLIDKRVQASDVVKLREAANVELVVEAGQPKGVRVKDATLVAALGLEAGDVITAISGRVVTREYDVKDALFTSKLRHATTLYVEVTRQASPTLLRWQLDGDLRTAITDTPAMSSSGFGSLTGPGPSGTLPSVPATPDPLLDTIEKVDDWHYKVPMATVEAWLANPMMFSQSGRIVPSVKNGQPNGFKLYAIRPSSALARLGFTNGDTVHSINGFELASPDDALQAYTKLRSATAMEFELTRRGKPVTLSVEITK